MLLPVRSEIDFRFLVKAAIVAMPGEPVDSGARTQREVLAGIEIGPVFIERIGGFPLIRADACLPVRSGPQALDECAGDCGALVAVAEEHTLQAAVRGAQLAGAPLEVHIEAAAMHVSRQSAQGYVETVGVAIDAERPEIVQGQRCAKVCGNAVRACVIANFRRGLLAVVVVAHADARARALCGAGSEVAAVAQLVSIGAPAVVKQRRIEVGLRMLVAAADLDTAAPRE